MEKRKKQIEWFFLLSIYLLVRGITVTLNYNFSILRLLLCSLPIFFPYQSNGNYFWSTTLLDGYYWESNTELKAYKIIESKGIKGVCYAEKKREYTLPYVDICGMRYACVINKKNGCCYIIVLIELFTLTISLLFSLLFHYFWLISIYNSLRLFFSIHFFRKNHFEICHIYQSGYVHKNSTRRSSNLHMKFRFSMSR